MKLAKSIWAGAVALAAAVAMPLPAFAQEPAEPGVIAVGDPVPAADPNGYRNRGPYIGGGVGYNQPDDMTFKFAGTSTVPVTQPTVPVELATQQNIGNASENEYEGNFFVQGTLGYKFSNGLRPEFEVSYRQNDADTVTEFGNAAGTAANPSRIEGVKITSTSGMFNLWYDFFPSWRIHPYIGGGGGFSRLKLHKQPTNQLSTAATTLVSTPGTTLPGPPVCLAQDCSGPRKSDDAQYAYQAGAGLRYDFSDTTTIGLDYRYLKTGEAEFFGFKDQQETHLDAEYETHSLMLSINYFFALPTPPAPPAPPPAVALVAPVAICSDGQDNDGDGQIDFPADPGCTAAEDNDETDPPQCSDGKDNDGDGLVDFPADRGCTGADDNDEVDPCKTPEPGERISLRGCGLGDVIVLRGVNFEFDKSRLTVNAKTILDNVAEELVAYPEIEVELSGHTDARGSDDYNQRLSDQRAASVKRYLVDKGIADARMTTVGHGESKPVADNETDEGRELNRRTELRVTKGTASAPPIVQDEASDPEPAAEPAPAADAPAAEPATAPSP